MLAHESFRACAYWVYVSPACKSWPLYPHQVLSNLIDISLLVSSLPEMMYVFVYLFTRIWLLISTVVHVPGTYESLGGHYREATHLPGTQVSDFISCKRDTYSTLFYAWYSLGKDIFFLMHTATVLIFLVTKTCSDISNSHRTGQTLGPQLLVEGPGCILRGYINPVSRELLCSLMSNRNRIFKYRNKMSYWAAVFIVLLFYALPPWPWQMPAHHDRPHLLPSHHGQTLCPHLTHISFLLYTDSHVSSSNPVPRFSSTVYFLSVVLSFFFWLMFLKQAYKPPIRLSDGCQWQHPELEFFQHKGLF